MQKCFTSQEEFSVVHIAGVLEIQGGWCKYSQVVFISLPSLTPVCSILILFCHVLFSVSGSFLD